jgi:hypothetical protein
MPILSISGVDAFSYADVAYADDYLVFDPTYSEWSALTNDAKSRFLVTATRFLDTLNWAEPWDTQTEREAENKIVQACVILASMISRGEADFISTGTTASGTKRLKAGSAEIEFFGSASNSSASFGGSNQLPSQLWLLLKDFLIGANSNLAVGFLSFGTCGQSANRQKFGLTD